MRVTYRWHGGSRAYWGRRWSQIPADTGGLNVERYPGRYAEAIMRRVDGEVLEAGCGAGRVLLHYHRLGRRIVGVDYIETALAKIRRIESSVPLCVADITHLPVRDGRFAAILAFGLYHSLEHDIDVALAETRRALQPGGLLCASVRMDNLQNRLVDLIAARNAPKTGAHAFHKLNYTEREFVDLLKAAGFASEQIEYVENMPFFYKFRPLRHRTHRRFDENRARAEGYRLSWYGRALQRSLIALMPRSFCNIMVATARAI